MKAKSIKGKTPDEIQPELSESMGDGFKPTLAIVYASIKQERSSCKSWMKIIDEFVNCHRLQLKLYYHRLQPVD
jgi:hypothetical protein